jgi:hypothetical protein
VTAQVRSLVLGLVLTATALAQQPSAARIEELVAAFPQLRQTDDWNRGGYIRDPSIRFEAATPELEAEYSEKLSRLVTREEALFVAETAVKDASVLVETRRNELFRAEIRLDAAEAFLQQLQSTTPPGGADPDLQREIEEARRRLERERKARDRAAEELQSAESDLGQARETETFERTRFEGAAAEESQAWNVRNEWLATHPTFTFDTGLGCSLQGMAIQRNTIVVRFVDTATIPQIKRKLADHRLTIRSGIPEISLFVVELESLAFPTPQISRVLRLKRVIRALARDPLVVSAVQHGTLGTATVPPPVASSAGHSCWDWYDAACVGIAGAKRIRFPQAWNFNDAIRRRPDTNRQVTVAVLDEGFQEHEDLSITQVCETSQALHGNHVAGILGATFDDKGVNGATQFLQLIGCAAGSIQVDCPGDNSIAFIGFMVGLRTLLADHQPSIINVSLGYNWVVLFGPRSAPEMRPDIQRLVQSQGSAVRDLLAWYRKNVKRDVVVISAAGNDCGSNVGCTNSAEWTSPINWAALAAPAPPAHTPAATNVFVVASLRSDGTFATASNKNATLAAPGEFLLCPGAQSLYGLQAGSSLAAPMASGVVAMMLAYNPMLTPAEIREKLTDGGTSIAKVDAFVAMLRARSDSLVDLADLSCDGEVDMDDFAIFKSHLQQTETGVFRDDLNDDGTPNSNDRYFPRSDLNGDGKLSRCETHPMFGFATDPTDLDVLKKAWTDPNVLPTDLHLHLDD